LSLTKGSGTLAIKGSGTFSLSKLFAIASLLTTAAVLSAVILLENQTAAQPRQDNPRPSPQSQSVSQPIPPNALSLRVKTRVVPAPAEVKVAGGRGRILVYALDQERQRIPDPAFRPPVSSKEVVREVHWAVVTGIVDHRAIQASFSEGRRVAPLRLEGIYSRVDLQRQSHEARGGWSEWQSVAHGPTLEILDNLPEEDPEQTPNDIRLDALVDPLPHLTDGVWSGVDVERLVPRPSQRMAGIAHLGESNQSNLRGLMRTSQAIEGPLPPVLMLRAFDFTVRPGRTYRYRARLVLFTPTEKDSTASTRGSSDFRGPWSEPTNSVAVP
jgi:hypothetical protein